MNMQLGMQPGMQRVHETIWESTGEADSRVNKSHT